MSSRLQPLLAISGSDHSPVEPPGPLPSPMLGGEAMDPQEAQLDPFSCWVWCAFSLLCSQHTMIMTVKILTIVTECQLCPRCYARLCT